MDYINTDEWDWYSLESRYLNLEKKENKKKYYYETFKNN